MGGNGGRGQEEEELEGELIWEKEELGNIRSEIQAWENINGAHSSKIKNIFSIENPTITLSKTVQPAKPRYCLHPIKLTSIFADIVPETNILTTSNPNIRSKPYSASAIFNIKYPITIANI